MAGEDKVRGMASVRALQGQSRAAPEIRAPKGSALMVQSHA